MKLITTRPDFIVIGKEAVLINTISKTRMLTDFYTGSIYITDIFGKETRYYVSAGQDIKTEYQRLLKVLRTPPITERRSVPRRPKIRRHICMSSTR